MTNGECCSWPEQDAVDAWFEKYGVGDGMTGCYMLELKHAVTAPRLAVQAERDKLKAFAQDLLNVWPDGDIDGGDLQDIAVKHGLLKPTMMDEPCGEFCHCAEFYSEDEWPVECFRKTDLIRETDT